METPSKEKVINNRIGRIVKSQEETLEIIRSCDSIMDRVVFRESSPKDSGDLEKVLSQDNLTERLMEIAKRSEEIVNNLRCLTERMDQTF